MGSTGQWGGQARPLLPASAYPVGAGSFFFVEEIVDKTKRFTKERIARLARMYPSIAAAARASGVASAVLCRWAREHNITFRSQAKARARRG